MGRTWVAAAPGLLRRRQHFGSNGNDFEMTLFSQQFLGFLGWPIFTFHFGLQAAEFKKVVVVVREEKHDIFSWWEVDSLSREARQKTDSLARAARKYDVPDPSDRRWDSGSEGQTVHNKLKCSFDPFNSVNKTKPQKKYCIQMFDEVLIAMTWIATLGLTVLLQRLHDRFRMRQNEVRHSLRKLMGCEVDKSAHIFCFWGEAWPFCFLLLLIITVSILFP